MSFVRRSTWLGVLWGSLILLLASCNFDYIFSSASPSSKAMAHELETLVDNGDPLSYYHWNSKRAILARKKITESPPQQYLNNFFAYCYENLNAGNSAQVISEIEDVMAQANISITNYNPKDKPKYELLALAYLRAGEQDNCISNHSPYSCLIPLQEEGQHTQKKGSQGAIKILNFLLAKHPEDLQLRWLLNLAHMTLGSYPEALTEQQLITLPEPIAFPTFKEIAMSTGVAQDGLSGGVCVEDFNGDGYLDIFCTSYGMEDQVQYFENNQLGGFDNKTATAGIKGIVGGLNCLHADYDGDGHRDILILRGGWLGAAGTHPNSLLRNTGDGYFEDVTYQAGLTTKLPCKTATFFDYDLDGDLDIFFGNEAQRGLLARSELFENIGGGTFVDVAQAAGVAVNAFVKGVTAADYNNDGYPDLYLSILGSPNLLYLNQKNGQFKEVAEQAGVQEPKMSFPTWFFDVNNDGWQDLFVGSYDVKYQNTAAHDYATELLGRPAREEQPRLYINQQDGTFEEVSEAYGVRRSMYAMGSSYGDLDKDGFLDFYIGTGTPQLGSVVPNRMFRNVNGKSFEEVTYAGFGHIQKGHGVAFADLNNDGDQEVYAVMGGAFEGDNFTNVLFDADPNTNNWITIRLRASQANTDALGAKIKVTTSAGVFHRVITGGGSFGSHPLRMELGLGQCADEVTVDIAWPDKVGTLSHFDKIAVNQSYLIHQADNTISMLDAKSFSFSTKMKDHLHH